MNFLSVTYLLFLTIFVIIYYLTREKYRYLCLLVGSYLFYMWADIKMIFILLLATAITYIGGRVIAKNRKWFWFFFLANIIILLFYKYTDFIVQNLERFFQTLGLGSISHTGIQLAVPLGLSFYIFQSATYLGDVRNGRIEPMRNVLKYAVFVAFFPTVSSGPIQKARDLIPQLAGKVVFQFENIQKGMIFILYGFVEKLIVSNHLAVIVNEVFDNWTKYGGGVYYLFAASCFSLQIYSDFSAYSDIARGTAKLFGINVGKNFNNPYLSKSISEFWRTWHISLNSWLVEYVYIPLGGNRKGKWREYLNIMVVFLISGAWHGASWHYIAWGGANACLQLAEKWIKEHIKIHRKAGIGNIVIILRRMAVFLMITITWVFFRVPGVRTGIHIVKNMLYFSPRLLLETNFPALCGSLVRFIFTMGTVVCFLVVQYLRKEEERYYCVLKKQTFLKQCIFVSVLAYLVFFGMAGSTSMINTQFIYFQF